MKDIRNNIPLEDSNAFQRRLKSRRGVIQSFESKSNANRSVAERAADYMTSHLGSMGFLLGLLTMIVSLEAIFLAIIVLISQNRAGELLSPLKWRASILQARMWFFSFHVHPCF